MIKMKKLLILIVFTTTLSVYAVEYNIENMGFYKGNPFENKIISSGDMYVVIHNPTELALTVMQIGAKVYCEQTLGNHFTSNFVKILGRYTAYFSCNEQNKLDHYNLTDAEKKCIEGRNYMSKDCLELNEKNADIIDIISL